MPLHSLHTNKLSDQILCFHTVSQKRTTETQECILQYLQHFYAVACISCTTTLATGATGTRCRRQCEQHTFFSMFLKKQCKVPQSCQESTCGTFTLRGGVLVNVSLAEAPHSCCPLATAYRDHSDRVTDSIRDLSCQVS